MVERPVGETKLRWQVGIVLEQAQNRTSTYSCSNRGHQRQQQELDNPLLKKFEEETWSLIRKSVRDMRHKNAGSSYRQKSFSKGVT